MSEEIWKDVPPEILAIEASSDGRLRWKRNGQAINPHLNAQGYPRIRPPFPVHYLVAAAWHGPRPAGLTVNHKDLNKTNNRPENLEYLTASENSKHAHRHGARKAPPKKWPNKNQAALHSKCWIVTQDRQIEMVRSYRGHGKLQRLAQEFGVSIHSARKVLFQHGVPLAHRSRLTPEQQEECLGLFQTGTWTKAALDRRYGVPPNTVLNLIKRKWPQGIGQHASTCPCETCRRRSNTMQLQKQKRG